jgi:hypothetical protein
MVRVREKCRQVIVVLRGWSWGRGEFEQAASEGCQLMTDLGAGKAAAVILSESQGRVSGSKAMAQSQQAH